MFNLAENPRAVVGGNMPADPHAAMLIHVEALFETAQGFLDGEPIADQQTADTVSLLIEEARKARKDADTMRKEEAKPFDDGKSAVQAKWTPLLSRLELVNDTAKKALVPFLAAQEAKRIEAERVARAEAAQKAQEAADALRAAGNDLTTREDAERAVSEADAANKTANRIGKAKSQAKGGARAIGLRSYWVPTLTDPSAALRHYRETQPNALKDWLLDQAGKDVAGGARTIPGFAIEEQRRAQ